MYDALDQRALAGELPPFRGGLVPLACRNYIRWIRDISSGICDDAAGKERQDQFPSDRDFGLRRSRMSQRRPSVGDSCDLVGKVVDTPDLFVTYGWCGANDAGSDPSQVPYLRGVMAAAHRTGA
ncbi:MAG TPA: hypothetical protein VGD80_13055 [Kofleriaceae bacterium]